MRAHRAVEEYDEHEIRSMTSQVSSIFLFSPLLSLALSRTEQGQRLPDLPIINLLSFVFLCTGEYVVVVVVDEIAQ